METITVYCHGKPETWHNRSEAIAFYAEGVAACEGSEQERYANILTDLLSGASVATDE